MKGSGGDHQLSPSRRICCVMSTRNGLRWRLGVEGGRASVTPLLTPIMALTSTRGTGHTANDEGPRRGYVGLSLTRSVALLVLNAPILGPCRAGGAVRAPSSCARCWPRAPGSTRIPPTENSAPPPPPPPSSMPAQAPPRACPGC